MSTMVLEVYDALKEAGASEDASRDAAKAVLRGDTTRLDSVDSRLDRIETRLDKPDSRFDRLDATLNRIDARINTHNWMIGACTTLVILVLGKLLLLAR